MNTARQRPARRAAATSAALMSCLLTILAATAHAGPREQAKRIHDRLAGTPPSETTLTAMTTDITNGNPVAAAMKAMDASSFYTRDAQEFRNAVDQP